MSEYITTYTGNHFKPTNPDPELIRIEDIAHALSLICRGNGHVKTSGQWRTLYLLMQKRLLPEACLTVWFWPVMLHDASECYMSDVPSPLKKSCLSIRYGKNSCSV